MRSLSLGKFDRLELRAKPSAVITFFGLWLALAALFWKLLKTRPRWAISFGLLAALGHFALELWHQLGHGRAARLTGYNMKGMTFVGPLAVSVYPRQEPAIPADVHIQRALGGPIFSAFLTLLLSLATLALRPLGGPLYALMVLLLADNTFVFILGALLPLGFTDGSTLLAWWPKRGSQQRLFVNAPPS